MADSRRNFARGRWRDTGRSLVSVDFIAGVIRREAHCQNRCI